MRSSISVTPIPKRQRDRMIGKDAYAYVSVFAYINREQSQRAKELLESRSDSSEAIKGTYFCLD